VWVIADISYDRVKGIHGSKYTVGNRANTRKHRNTQCDYIKVSKLAFFPFYEVF
jgi:hypothetical protein